jgi:hypothetical protein
MKSSIERIAATHYQIGHLFDLKTSGLSWQRLLEGGLFEQKTIVTNVDGLNTRRTGSIVRRCESGAEGIFVKGTFFRGA